MSAKSEEKSQVLMHFGRLIAPASDLAEQAIVPTEAEYRILTAQFEPNLCRWENEVSDFVTVGGSRFANEYDRSCPEVV